MQNNSLPGNSPLNGYVGLGLFNNGEIVSDILQWTDLNALWQAFNSSSYGDKKMSDPSPQGSTYNGALLVPKSFTFVTKGNDHRCTQGIAYLHICVVMVFS